MAVVAAPPVRGWPGKRDWTSECENTRHARDVYRQAFSRQWRARFTCFDNSRTYNTRCIQVHVLLLSYFYFFYTQAHFSLIRFSINLSLTLCAILMELNFKRSSARPSAVKAFTFYANAQLTYAVSVCAKYECGYRDRLGQKCRLPQTLLQYTRHVSRRMRTHDNNRNTRMILVTFATGNNR